jgi:DNA invertase Pin-like site-specific DNA recombinase
LSELANRSHPVVSGQLDGPFDTPGERRPELVSETGGVRNAGGDEFRTLAAMGQLLGYARVSTDLQDPALQHDALAAAGCDKVWTDHASGTATARPELAAVLEYARAGDVLVVWRLDRLGRSVQHLVSTVTDLAARGVELRSLNEGIDTTTATGRLTFHIFAAVAEFEADLIRARTVAGLDAARARGRVGGRPSVMTPEKAAAATELLGRPGTSVTAVARALGVSRASVYRFLESSRPAAEAVPATREP